MTLRTFLFSPTGTSRRVAEAIVRGIAPESCLPLDATRCTLPAATIPQQETALFAVPVYGGRVAPLALERLARLRGEGTPAVLVVLYGNRAYGKAVRELAAFVSCRGFVPVAAAAFVGEHSYSSAEFPIAAGRPDAGDLRLAQDFGRAVREKLSGGSPSPVDPAALPEPRTPLLPLLRFIRFVLSYRRRQKKNPAVLLPQADAERCVQCGKCAAACPSQAIAKGDYLHTDPARCIRCCACVKGCPTGARTFSTPFAAALSRNFRKRKPPVTLL